MILIGVPGWQRQETKRIGQAEKLDPNNKLPHPVPWYYAMEVFSTGSWYYWVLFGNHVVQNKHPLISTDSSPSIPTIAQG